MAGDGTDDSSGQGGTESDDNEFGRVLAYVQHHSSEAVEAVAEYDESHAHYQLQQILFELAEYYGYKHDYTDNDELRELIDDLRQQRTGNHEDADACETIHRLEQLVGDSDE